MTTNESVVLILSKTNPNIFGTGFIIYKESGFTYILTCAHVLDDLDGQILIEKESAEIVISGADFGIDLAILRIAKILTGPLLTIGVEAKKGDSVTVIGFQQFGNYHRTKELEGILLSRVALLSPMKIGRIEAWDLEFSQKDPLKKGFSGAPVISHGTDKVVAVVSHKQGEGQKGLGIAIENLIHLPVHNNPILNKIISNIKNVPSDASNYLRKEDLSEAPDPDEVFGRKKEILVLHNKVEIGTRVLGVFGIGGIGKSSIVSRLVHEIKKNFEFIVWRSMQNEPSIDYFLDYLINTVSGNIPQQLNSSTEEKIRIVTELISEHKTLIILDNLEDLLLKEVSAGVFKPDHVGYSRLILQISQSSKTKSCVIVTSREVPKLFDILENDKVYSFFVEGVSVTEAKIILKNKNLHGRDDDWLELISLYGGNPLALKLVAAVVSRIFDGSLEKFLTEGQILFSSINNLIEEQFDRLTEPELAILYWLTIERQIVNLNGFDKNVWHNYSKLEIFEAVESLLQRSLIQKGRGSQFSLQPVVQQYSTEQLIQISCQELKNKSAYYLRSHCLMRVDSLEHIRNAQKKIIIQPITKNLEKFLGKEHAENLMMEIIRNTQKTLRLPGYIAGNIINLMSEMGSKLSYRDFSNLSIWQADFTNVDLVDTNFQNSDLKGSLFLGAFSSILSVTFNASGSMFAAAGVDGKIRIWDTKSGDQLKTFEKHTDWIWSIAFTNNLLASAGDDQTIRVWDVDSGELKSILHEHKNRVRTIAVSPDQSILASGSEDKTIKIWSLVDFSCINTIPVDEGVHSICFSPDGKYLLIGQPSKAVMLDLSAGQKAMLRTFNGHKDRIRSVAFHPDGKIVAIGSYDGTISIWDISDPDPFMILDGHQSWVMSIAFTANGLHLVSSSADRTIRIWNIATGSCDEVLVSHSGIVWSIALSQDIVLSGGDDNAIILWDAISGACIRIIKGYTNPIWSVSFNEQGNLLASGSEDAKVRIWDIKSENEKIILSGHQKRIWSLAFNPNGHYLASGSADNNIIIWKISDNSILNILSGHRNWVNSLKFFPDGKYLMSGGNDKKIIVWDYLTNTKEFEVDLPSRVWELDINPNGSLFATCSEDTFVRLWETGSGKLLSQLDGHTSQVLSCSFSQDGKILATGGSDTTIRIWDISQQKQMAILTGHMGQIRSVKFIKNNILASSSDDATVRLWDLEKFECATILKGHTNQVRSLSYSHTENLLASASTDETIALWNLSKLTVSAYLRIKKPYNDLNLSNIHGLTPAQIKSLLQLGAKQ